MMIKVSDIVLLRWASHLSNSGLPISQETAKQVAKEIMGVLIETGNNK